MNKKNIIIIAGIAALLIIVVLSVILFNVSRNPSSNNSNNSTNSAATNSPWSLDLQHLPEGNTIQIPNKTNGPVTVNNFIAHAQSVEPDRVNIDQGVNTGIAYSLPDSTFYITISAEDDDEFYKLQKEVEFEFLDKTGLTQDEACNVRVQELTLPNDEGTMGSQVLPLSFCTQNQ